MKKSTTKITDAIWKANGLPVPIREYKFVPNRRFRADFAFLKEKLLVEIDGGCWIRRGHTRGRGFIKDTTKGNLAVELGYRVLHYIPKAIDFEQIKRVLEL